MAEQWPNWEKIESIVKQGNFMSGNDEFTTFKKQVVKSSPEQLSAQAAHAPAMWEFLIGFAAVKKMYRNHIIQVVHKLIEVPSWAEAWEGQPALHEKLRGLHEDLQAALGAQHEVLQKSLTPAALASMAKVRAEDRPDEVRRDIARERLVEEVRAETGNVSAFDGGAPSTDEEVAADTGGAGAGGGGAAGGDGGAGTSSSSSSSAPYRALQDGVDAAVAIDDPSKLDSGGTDAINRLRIGCIMCAGKEEIMRKEADCAPSVFVFLLSYARRWPESVHRAAEVMNLLLASPSWSEMFDCAPLRETIQELPIETQAALGMQHAKVLALVVPQAQQRAAGGDVSEQVKSVIPKLESIRGLPAGGLTGGQSSRPVSAKPPPKDEWKEAKTCEGHIYYYNLLTRESTWERPAALGGPHVYKVGEEVEVWSNGQRVWGRGKVEKVEDGKVLAAFTLPGGAAAKKELPATHRDLRLAVGGRAGALDVSTAGGGAGGPAPVWTPEEREKYERLFREIPGGTDEVKPGAAVAQFLSKSGLRRPALKQLWNVANPGCKTDLGFEEFARCCRLVAHCQALGPSDPVLVEAERPLRVKLREECMPVKPPALPTFGA